MSTPATTSRSRGGGSVVGDPVTMNDHTGRPDHVEATATEYAPGKPRMIGSSRFVPNRGAIAALMRIPEMGRGLKMVADGAADAARSRAPVEHGDYRDGIEGRVA